MALAGFCVRYEARIAGSKRGRPRGLFPQTGSRVFSQMAEHCRRTIGAFLAERGYRAVEGWDLPIKPAVVRAGLGCYGKRGVVVTPQLGSIVMFAAVVTDAPLAVTEAPLRSDPEVHRRVVPSFSQQAGIAAMRGNAAIALGNCGEAAAAAALVPLLDDSDPQLRGYAAWSLGRLGAWEVLEAALPGEREPSVVAEIRRAFEMRS